jgi:DNA-binding PadR family transcriptional regulator
MVEPAVLFLLGQGDASHGYDLATAATGLGLSEGEIDPGAVYRTLRQLEEDGCVVSDWDTEGAGPARRTYQLSPLGWERLEAWLAVMERRTEAMQQFVQDCGALLDEKG